MGSTLVEGAARCEWYLGAAIVAGDPAGVGCTMYTWHEGSDGRPPPIFVCCRPSNLAVAQVWPGGFERPARFIMEVWTADCEETLFSS
eukprot:3767355-Prymnesium_polylepis.3